MVIATSGILQSIQLLIPLTGLDEENLEEIALNTVSDQLPQGSYVSSTTAAFVAGGVLLTIGIVGAAIATVTLPFTIAAIVGAGLIAGAAITGLVASWSSAIGSTTSSKVETATSTLNLAEGAVIEAVTKKLKEEGATAAQIDAVVKAIREAFAGERAKVKDRVGSDSPSFFDSLTSPFGLVAVGLIAFAFLSGRRGS